MTIPNVAIKLKEIFTEAPLILNGGNGRTTLDLGISIRKNAALCVAIAPFPSSNKKKVNTYDTGHVKADELKKSGEGVNAHRRVRVGVSY